MWSIVRVLSILFACFCRELLYVLCRSLHHRLQKARSRARRLNKFFFNPGDFERVNNEKV